MWDRGSGMDKGLGSIKRGIRWVCGIKQGIRWVCSVKRGSYRVHTVKRDSRSICRGSGIVCCPHPNPIGEGLFCGSGWPSGIKRDVCRVCGVRRSICWVRAVKRDSRVICRGGGRVCYPHPNPSPVGEGLSCISGWLNGIRQGSCWVSAANRGIGGLFWAIAAWCGVCGICLVG